MKYKTTKEELELAVKNSLSIAQVCRLLNIRPVGGNYKTLRSKIKLWNVDISHFTGQGWNTGSRYKNVSKSRPLNEIMIENSTYVSTGSLKRRLFKEGLKIQECEICKITSWNNKPICLELDHKSGINTDNRIENLQILCPNCHSQTDNFRGKNKLSALSEKKDVEYRKFRESLTANPEPSLVFEEGAETLHGTSKVKIPKIKGNCTICNKELIKKMKYCSYECLNIARSVKIPNYQDLIEAFKEHKNFLQVGKHFNVSDNSIRKWCIRYGILDMMKRKSRPQIE